MDILYRRGRAAAGDVMADLPGEPSYSTVRTQLRVLEEKGHVVHEEDGLRYVYAPAVPRHAARKSALRHLVDTFFDGSAEQVVAAVLGGEAARLTDEDLDRIARLVAKARKEGRNDDVPAREHDQGVARPGGRARRYGAPPAPIGRAPALGARRLDRVRDRDAAPSGRPAALARPAVSALLGPRLAPIVLLVPVPIREGGRAGSPTGASATPCRRVSAPASSVPIWLGGRRAEPVASRGRPRAAALARRARAADRRRRIAARGRGRARRHGPRRAAPERAAVAARHLGLPAPEDRAADLRARLARLAIARRARARAGARRAPRLDRPDGGASCCAPSTGSTRSCGSPAAGCASRASTPATTRVLALGIDGSDYAAHLLDLARASAQPPPTRGCRRPRWPGRPVSKGESAPC